MPHRSLAIFFTSLFIPSSSGERAAARDYTCRVLMDDPVRLARSLTRSLARPLARPLARLLARARQTLHFYVIKADTRREERAVRGRESGMCMENR